MRTLLFIDPDEGCRKLYQEIFANNPAYRALTVGDVEDARLLLRKEAVHLIIASRPDSGYATGDLLRFCRHAAVEAKKRVLLVGSAYNDHFKRRQETEDTQAKAALPKPFTIIQLRQTIDTLLSGDKPIVAPDFLPDTF